MCVRVCVCVRACEGGCVKDAAIWQYFKHLQCVCVCMRVGVGVCMHACLSVVFIAVFKMFYTILVWQLGNRLHWNEWGK